MLNKIDKYILKNFLGTFVFLLAAFSVIAIVIDFTEKINDFVDRKVPFFQILLYFRNFIPYILALLFPIFIFVAVIFFTSRMANRSELIAVLSSGMTFKKDASALYRWIGHYFGGLAFCQSLCDSKS
ncbi:MAG: LptF/LptG family permease [Bacteroidetes bacterium]|nr:LptF/LptG family permease [Bacteroidota bacterium]